MGAATYYAPLWLIPLLTALAVALGSNGLWERPGWQAALLLIGISGATGLLCQIGLIGMQGAFAQVLPVPGGRTVRGSGAVLSGVLLLATVGLGLVYGLFAWEGARSQAFWSATAAGAALVAALAVYAWSLPAATRDFGGDRGR